MGTAIRSAHSSYGYGHCWIEQKGVDYYVYSMNGDSERGPFSSLQAALEYFATVCP